MTTTNENGTASENGHNDPPGDLGHPGEAGVKAPDIRKVKLVKGDTLAISFYKPEPDGTTGKDDYTNPERKVHGDCKRAFDALIPHFALLMDYMPLPPRIEDIKFPLDEILPTEEARRYSVTAVTLGPDDSYFILTGSRSRAFDNMPIVGINTPKEPNGASNYRYFRELEESIKTVIEEANAWLDGSKKGIVYIEPDEEEEADDRQIKLFELNQS